MSKPITDDAAIYAIGAAAELAGLSPNTVRTWERRYRAVEPSRTRGGGRRYTDADVERLQLLRVLTSSGASIGDVAALATDELRQRAGRLTGSDARVARPLRVAVVHPTLATRLRSHPSGWTIVGSASTVAKIVDDVAEGEVDAAMIDLAGLSDDAEGAIERCREALGDVPIVVLYHFAPRRVLSELSNAGARLAREPINLSELHRMVCDQMAVLPVTRPIMPPPSPAESHERRYSDADLAKLQQVASSLDCECPNHLASIISSLVAFEAYSARCDGATPEDFQLHRRLHDETARARAAMEQLLREVCAHDGIEV